MEAEAVDVVIPTYNGRHHLEGCLPALRRQTHPRVRVLVVDNGSADGTLEWLESEFPWVERIALGRNLGFSAAVNAGIRYSTAPFIALLNNDTVPSDDWVRALAAGLVGDSSAGFATSKIVSLDDPSIMDNAGDGFGRKGISYPIGYLEPDVGQYETPRHVFGACGAACIFRREMFDRIGVFDEDFFAYHEDADISFRARLAGYECLFVPGAVVRHRGSATSGTKINPFTVYLSTRNNLHVLMKNMPIRLLLRYLPWLVWGQAYWFLKMAVKEGMWAAWTTGLIAGLRDSARMLRKRRAILSGVRVDLASLHAAVRQSEREIRESIQSKRRARRERRP